MGCKFIKDVGMRFPKMDSPKRYRYCLVECPVCGKEFETQTRWYKNGMKSCRDCKYKIIDQSKFNLKHGLRRHPLYEVWSGMKSRCNNRNKRSYADYGARGISVCEEWAKDFKPFYDWAINNGFDRSLQIDRIDGNGNYSPDNCRFVTPTVNANNVCRIRKNNKVGATGVCIDKSTGKYLAQISQMVDGKRKNKFLGRFDTVEEASNAYNKSLGEKLKTTDPERIKHNGSN